MSDLDIDKQVAEACKWPCRNCGSYKAAKLSALIPIWCNQYGFPTNNRPKDIGPICVHCKVMKEKPLM